jgi:large subunit ribosomal protein L4e
MTRQRKQVNVFSITGDRIKSMNIPPIFDCPIRRDIVDFIHTNMRKNKRQSYGVKCQFGPTGIVAGHQHSARSWGTGRAVSRIPRVSGGGTHRAGQGAFGNMCRGGRMFAPTKTFRRWHKKLNTSQKRYAVTSCLAASASVSLIEARGCKIIDEVKEIPIVVQGIECLNQTKEAIHCLKVLGLGNELEKCRVKKTRPTKGKMRGRKIKQRKGPLIIYEKNLGLLKAFRNIPGVDFCSVNALNLLQLAPGGHLGRLIIWSTSSFKILENWLDNKKTPKILMINSDLHTLINSDEIQSIIRGVKKKQKRIRKTNLLRNEKIRYETFRGFSKEQLEIKNNKM